LDAVKGPYRSATSWPDAVYRGMGAFVDYLVAHEALLRIAFIDLLEVGPGMIGRMTRSVDAFVKFVTDEAPTPRRGPEVAREAVAGALWAIVGGYVANARLSRLPCLVEHLTFVVLAPYLGPKAAVQSIQESRRPLRAV
jgi:hypothetical protein